MPIEPTSPPRLRKENSHEHNIATTTATTWPTEGVQQPRQPPSPRSEQRPPSRRTTSTRSLDDSNEHNNNVRNEEIDNDVIELKPRFDRCLISSELHRRLQQNGPLSSIFCFLLVVLSIFLSKPSRHHKLLRHGFEPQLSNIFSLHKLHTNFSLDLVRSLERGTDSSDDFFQSNCNHHSFLTVP